jgi:hypothetical protein
MSMQYETRISPCLLGTVLCLGSISAWAEGPAGGGEVLNGEWQHHKVTFDYFGANAKFTCDGLAEHVRSILRTLGARQDLTVSARGCLGRDQTPTRTAWVTAQFSTLVPAAGAATDTVQARWTEVKLEPHSPSFMGDGDCELMQEMKDLITGSFSLRDVSYRTDCTPNQLFPNGYSVDTQALRALQESSSRAQG